MKEAIQKAIEGGYVTLLENKPCYCHSDPKCINAEKGYNEYQILLDPLFWQALGKALGWDDKQGTPDGYLTFKEATGDDYWLYQWHRFIDHLAEGKDAESFFKDLLSQ